MSLSEGRLLTTVDSPERTKSVLTTSTSAGVSARDPADFLEGGVGGTAGKVCVARAEMTLTSSDSRPLRPLPLKPDPLTPFARAVAELVDAQSESAEVVVSLLPLRRGAVRRWKRRHLRRSHRGGPGGNFMAEFMSGMGAAPGNKSNRSSAAAESGLESIDRKTTTRSAGDKVTTTEPLFSVQVLLRTRSRSKTRARQNLGALVAGFEQWSGDNRWKVWGQRFGPVFLGSDCWWRRYQFDRRLSSGAHRPRRRIVLSASEVAGFLKPPTVHCQVPTVVRSGGIIPAAPQALPTYKFGAGQYPIGVVTTRAGERVVATDLDGVLFSLISGRSGVGKSWSAMAQFKAVVDVSGRGGMFLDPHADALVVLKEYLGHLGARVLEVDLSPRGPDARQAGWNLFSMEGRTAVDIEARVSAVVDSFASTLSWGEVNNRALTLTTMAAQSLCELALVLPADLAPTIFQMTTILSNEEWRQVVSPHLSVASRDFWDTRFRKLAADAITPVTNLIDRLRSSPSVASLLGSSRSTYDVRKAMDQGYIVLACPGGGGDKDRLVANFMIYDVLQAALSRRALDLADRRPFHLFVDEMQAVDGAAGDNLAALLEQCRKFGLRLHSMVQQMERLTETTRNALLTNRTSLGSFVVGAKSAHVLAAEWRNEVAWETITVLEKYHSIVSITHKGTPTPPFLVRGLDMKTLWPDHHHPEMVPALDEAIDETMGRVPMSETLAALDTLDERIVAHLAGPPKSKAPVKISLVGG